MALDPADWTPNHWWDNGFTPEQAVALFEFIVALVASDDDIVEVGTGRYLRRVLPQEEGTNDEA